MKNNRFAFTLVELMIVVTIVCILAIVGIASHARSKNKAISNEAIANVRLIAAAERILKMESTNDAYVDCDDTSDCNTKLRLNLAANINWGYRVDASGAGPTAAATITATSVAYSGCTYSLDSTDFNASPSKGGTCPAGMN